MADKFTVGDGCWEWTGAKQRGYGAISAGGDSDSRKGGRTLRVHRVLYEIMVGPVPEGMELDHLCRNRACVRPGHLEPVTTRENALRGEGAAGRNARKTHCSQGHPYDEANTRLTNGHRVCRACHRASERERKAAARG